MQDTHPGNSFLVWCHGTFRGKTLWGLGPAKKFAHRIGCSMTWNEVIKMHLFHSLLKFTQVYHVEPDDFRLGLVTTLEDNFKRCILHCILHCILFFRHLFRIVETFGSLWKPLETSLRKPSWGMETIQSIQSMFFFLWTALETSEERALRLRSGQDVVLLRVNGPTVIGRKDSEMKHQRKTE